MSSKAKIGTLTPQQVKKKIKLIKRRHKLYVRDIDDSIRRLDKISQDLYDLVIVLFLKGDGEKRYAGLNKGVKSWKQYEPIHMPLEEEFHEKLRELNKVLKQPARSSVVVSYNGSWKPLVRLKFGGEKEVINTDS